MEHGGEHPDLPRLRPLVGYLAWRRPDRVQLVFLFLYLIGAAHLSFFSLADRDPIDARHWLLSTWLPLLLPIWVVDGEMNRRRSVRLFVWPMADVARLVMAYALARSARAVTVAVVVTLLTLNTTLLVDARNVRIVAACGLLGLFVAAFVTFWNIVAGGRSVYPTIYASAVILLWALSRLAESRVAVEVAQWLVMPVWLLDPVAAAQVVGDPLRVLQACTASAVWFSASWFVIHHSYR